MEAAVEYLEAGGGEITGDGKAKSISVEPQFKHFYSKPYIRGFGKLLRAALDNGGAKIEPVQDGSRYAVLNFTTKGGYRQILHDLIKKDMPVFGSIFIGDKTCTTLEEILATRSVSKDNRVVLAQWFPALHDLLFPYEFENPFHDSVTRLSGLEEVLKHLVNQYRKYATVAGESELNVWQPLSDDEERHRYQEELLKNGVINPNIKGWRKLHTYMGVPAMRSTVPGVVNDEEDSVGDDCGKDYGSVKHNDLTNGSVIICCPHGFVLSKNVPQPFTSRSVAYLSIPPPLTFL